MSAYLLTETAEQELREVLDYVAEDSGVDRALHVLGHLEDAFERLADAPDIGFHRHQLTSPDVRWWPVFRYLVLYDPESEPLAILRILHGVRDLDAILDGPASDR